MRSALARPDQGEAQSFECPVQAVDRVRHALDLLDGELVFTAVAHEIDEQRTQEHQQDRQNHRLVDDVQEVQDDGSSEDVGDAGDRVPLPAHGLTNVHRLSSTVFPTWHGPERARHRAWVRFSTTVKPYDPAGSAHAPAVGR